MARKKIKKISEKKSLRKNNKNFVEKFKLMESYTSLVLGAIVVLIVGILAVSLVKVNKNLQTSSVKNFEELGLEESQNNSNTSSTYTIKPGDDLWSISENIYKNGYKWVEIAKINNLENPGLIYVGNKLTLPKSSSSEAVKENSETEINRIVSLENTITENNSIIENTYTIKSGDNLWDIAVRAYGDGFRWPEIANANNLENPSLIFSDNILQIPR